jgi:uncharacterized caspase-like protein
MMNDNQKDVNDNLYPTRENIIAQLRELISLANSNSDKTVLLFLSYSGHGSYVRDTNGDEADGRDEVLCPVDCDTKGYITDDTLKSYFVYKLPKNVKLVALIDACHSGTVMDLKYDYKINKLNTYSIHGSMFPTQCNIVMISGCRDNQTSSDAYLKDNKTGSYEYQGAMTAAFLANYKKGISSYDLIVKMRKWLKENGFDQIPQLSSGKQIETKNKFLLGYF